MCSSKQQNAAFRIALGTCDFRAAQSTGTLDLDFNTTGFKTQPLASSVTAEEANGMGIMADDRILLAGTIVFSSAINEDVGIVMLKADSI